MAFLRLHSKSVTYAATTLGATMMHSVFMFYYVKVYLHRFHVSMYWFNLSQVMFMLWNAVNDPLFGCLQDSSLRCLALRTRRQSILYGAPLFALSFVLTWLPWADYTSETNSIPSWLSGLQLTFSLCFYDALFTFVLLAQCAMFTEMSVQQEDRVRLIRYAQVASLIGSTSVFFCESFSSSLQQWSNFLTACFVIALISLACFIYTGLHGRTQYDGSDTASNVDAVDYGKADVDSLTSSNAALVETVDQRTWTSLIATVTHQTFQIFAQRNFLSFIATNFLQIFHMTFLTNFASILCDQLIAEEYVGGSVRAIFYGSLFIVPQILVIVCGSWVSRYGYFQLIRLSYVVQIILGVSLALIGRHNPYFLVLFFLAECAIVNAIFSLFGLPLSDIIDVDYKQHSRRHPLSSMVFGLNALVTKPAMSLAPMLAVAYFNQHGYQQIHGKVSPINPSSIALSPSPSPQAAGSTVGNPELADAMFTMIWMLPLILGLVQLCTWSAYTIRDSHKQKQPQHIYT